MVRELRFSIVMLGCVLAAVGLTVPCKAGSYLPPEGDPIKNEVGAAFGYSHFTSEFLYRDWDTGSLRTVHGTHDTLSYTVGYRRYFNRRYTHPEVPFGYVPYNYRNSYLECVAVIAQDKSERTPVRISRWHTVGGTGSNTYGAFRIALVNHTRRIFYRGELQIAGDFGSRDLGDYRASLGVGLENAVAKLGLDAVITVHTRGSHTNTALGSRTSLEYTPTPYVRVATTPTWLLDWGAPDIWELSAPVSVAVMIPSLWLEIEPYFRYHRVSSGRWGSDEEYVASLTVRDYFSSSSVYGRIRYSKIEDEQGWYGFHGGGDYVFGKSLMVAAEYGYNLENTKDSMKSYRSYDGHQFRVHVTCYW